jgi:hypothetical protein
LLRERIEQLEGGATRGRATLPFGISAIDGRLPGGGLAFGALHEVAGGGNGAINGAARRGTVRRSDRCACEGQGAVVYDAAGPFRAGTGTDGAVARPCQGVSQIFLVNCMLTIAGEIPAPDVVERTDDSECHR